METIDTAPFLFTLCRTSVQAGVLVLIVLLSLSLFRRWLAPRWRCVLWLLVAVRLLLPFSPTSCASIFNWLPDGSRQPVAMKPARGAGLEDAGVAAGDTLSANPAGRPARAQGRSPTSPAIPDPTSMARASLASTETTVPAPQTVPWTTISVLIWSVGVVILAAQVVVSSVRLSRRFARLPGMTDPAVLAVLEDCRRLLGVRSGISVVESDKVSNPVLQGLIRPQLLLPRDFSKDFSLAELRYVFLHELAHVKRRDLWLNWLMALLQIVHWFNPLIWVAFARWRADRELACDALVLETTGAAENREYGRTMLRLLERFIPGAVAPGRVGILEDRRQLRQRIQMIAQFQPTPRWSALALILVVVIATGCLTNARTKEAVSSAMDETAAGSTPASTGGPLVLDLAGDYSQLLINGDQTNQDSLGIAGHQVFDGLPFEVDGRVVLYGRNFNFRYHLDRPDRVQIAVGRKFDELHVLHATYFADVDGEEIAYYQFNYADGTSARQPIRYGTQVRDFQRHKSEIREQLSDPDSKVIWRGPGMPEYQSTQRLFLSRLANPHPDKEVRTLDVVSTRHLASYFFDAITVSDRDPNRPVTPPCASGEPEQSFAGAITIRVLDARSGKPLPGALIQGTIDVNGAVGSAAPTYTSPTGEAILRYPVGSGTNIWVVVQKSHYHGQTANWSGNFPDTTTFRLVPTAAVGSPSKSESDGRSPAGSGIDHYPIHAAMINESADHAS